MKNIKEAGTEEIIRVTYGIESIDLRRGQTIKIVTDGTDFDKEIEGMIHHVNEDDIDLYEHGDIIPFEYIEEIIILSDAD